MLNTQNLESAVYTHPSLAKQRFYTRYAEGKITRQELAQSIEAIQPEPQVSWKYRIAAFIFKSVAMILLPPSARCND